MTKNPNLYTWLLAKTSLDRLILIAPKSEGCFFLLRLDLESKPSGVKVLKLEQSPLGIRKSLASLTRLTNIIANQTDLDRLRNSTEPTLAECRITIQVQSLIRRYLGSLCCSSRLTHSGHTISRLTVFRPRSALVYLSVSANSCSTCFSISRSSTALLRNCSSPRSDSVLLRESSICFQKNKTRRSTGVSSTPSRLTE